MDLNLSGLSLQDLSAYTFPPDNNIIHLNISNNNFTSLSSISSLNITKLIVKGNPQLTSLVGSPSTLTYIDASDCALTSLDGIPSGCIILIASGNHIADISALSSITSRMERLDLSQNNISTFVNIPACCLLILNDNLITSFDAAVIANVVAIRNNPISSWTGFETWTDTLEVDITGTNITSLVVPMPNIFLLNDSPINILDFTGANASSLRKNITVNRENTLYAAITYASPSLVPLSGSPPDQLALSVSQWRRINGIDGSPHAGNLTTTVTYGNLFLPGSSTETNILKYVGTGPTVFMVTLQLSINPAIGTVYFMVSKNRTANQISMTTNDIDTAGGRDVLMASGSNIVSGSNLLTLMTNDKISFYAASTAGCTVSVDSFFFLIKPIDLR